MKVVLLGLILVMFACGTMAAREGTSDLLTVYSDVAGAAPKVEAQAKRVYANKFRVVDVTTKQKFIPARLVNGATGSHRPDGTSNVLCMFIIGSDGRVSEAHVLKTTDQRISTTWLMSFRSRLYEPARLNGAPVASLGWIEAMYEPVPASSLIPKTGVW
ncbi:MAG: hypothetical protein ACXWAV_04555 [Chthoniobacterales bacterium]